MYIVDEQLTNISKSKERSLNFFWIGFTLYTIGSSLTATLIYISIAQLQVIQILGMLIFIYGVVDLLKFNIKNQYLKSIFTVYFLWLMGIVVRGFSADYNYLKELLFDQGYGIFIYFTPLMLLFPQNLAFYKKAVEYIFIFAIIYLVLCTIFIQNIFNPDRQSVLSQGIVENFSTLSFPIGFVLLTYIYHTPKRKLFANGVIMIMLLTVIYRARRALIFMCISTLLFYLMVYLIVSKRTLMVIYLAVIIGILGALFYSSLYNQTNFGIFNFLVERGDDDTRTGVEEFFHADMSTMDWIIGKGMRGEYYCPGIDALDTRGYRSVIETGYLEIILKGGIVSLVLLLLILVPAVILGLFYSKNILSKASAIWILLWIFYLYPTVANSFILHYLLIWMSVGICYNKKIRNLSNEFIKEYFLAKKWKK